MVNRRTVLLADANEEFRGMLRDAIEKTEEFTVVGSTGDGTEALQILSHQKPDLAVARRGNTRQSQHTGAVQAG